MSDGLLEARNGKGEQFGTERARALICENHLASGPEILAALRETVDTFTRGAPADDDRTAIVLKRRG
jgi:serine phosphatase RsbU (regulator of sigma subunit)